MMIKTHEIETITTAIFETWKKTNCRQEILFKGQRKTFYSDKRVNTIANYNNYKLYAHNVEVQKKMNQNCQN